MNIKEKILEIRKNLAVSFIFNDSKKTLTDKIIDKSWQSLQDSFKSKLGAIIRDK